MTQSYSEAVAWLAAKAVGIVMAEVGPSRVVAVLAAIAPALAIAGAALGEAIYYWPVNLFDVWGLEAHLAYQSVLVMALLLATALVGRLADFPGR